MDYPQISANLFHKIQLYLELYLVFLSLTL